MFVRTTATTERCPIQGSLLTMGEPGVPVSVGPLRRIDLDHGAWIDHAPGWLPGADAWFDRLVSGLTWQHARRPMYDRVVDVPRLIWSHDQPDLGPTELQVVEHLRAVASKLADHYRRPLPRLHANFYRDGDDSVAWHPDSVDCPSDALVAIVSLGAARTFAVRPLGGGSTHRFQLGRGDLLVMGGTTQQYYEHGVPKVAMAAPRISVMFRS